MTKKITNIIVKEMRSKSKWYTRKYLPITKEKSNGETEEQKRCKKY